LVPVFNGPIYKGILPDIHSLLPVSNFPNMINPVRTSQTLRENSTDAYLTPDNVDAPFYGNLRVTTDHSNESRNGR
jgi:hypothetical protein